MPLPELGVKGTAEEIREGEGRKDSVSVRGTHSPIITHVGEVTLSY